MNGIREREFRPLRSRIGFVFQDPASSFNPLLTIAECVAEPLVIHGRAKDAASARGEVDELLEAVQLPARLRRPLPARALRRAAPAREPRACARARARAAHRRRADLGARRLGAGARARAVRRAAARVRLRLAVHQPRPRRRRHPRRPHRGALPRQARRGGHGRRGARRARTTRTRSGCWRRCRCPTRSPRPNVERNSAGSGRPS